MDIETTGMSYTRGRVIEVAAIRVEAGVVTREYSSVVDPGTDLPPFITGLTGLTDRDLRAAPTFHDIADELHGILADAVFVAHNARFDYGFLKHEFQRTGLKFDPKLLCTVKLSRALYPAARGHKLQDVIDRCGLKVKGRHRAYDDAKAMWQFIQHTQSNFPAPLIEDAIRQQLKSPSLPKNLTPASVRNLPESPGVYIFEDDKGRPLYIGKSINIRKRVLSHFRSDYEYESEFKISQQVNHIETVVTGGELEALLLESKLIKDLQPVYNRQLRRRQKMTLARQRRDANGYIVIDIEDVSEINPDRTSEILGVYSTKGKAKQFLSQICKDLGLCPKLMGLEKNHGSCFAYHLKKCTGACCGAEPASAYNQRLLAAFEGRRLRDWPYASAVLIEERTDDDGISSMVVDQWCVIAEIRQDPECDPVVNLQGKMFDIDTYKILRSFLDSSTHKLNIRPVSQEWLQTIALGAVV